MSPPRSWRKLRQPLMMSKLSFQKAWRSKNKPYSQRPKRRARWTKVLKTVSRTMPRTLTKLLSKYKNKLNWKRRRKNWASTWSQQMEWQIYKSSHRTPWKKWWCKTLTNLKASQPRGNKLKIRSNLKKKMTKIRSKRIHHQDLTKLNYKLRLPSQRSNTSKLKLRKKSSRARAQNLLCPRPSVETKTTKTNLKVK